MRPRPRRSKAVTSRRDTRVFGAIVQGLATDFLTNRSCNILNCGGMDAAVQSSERQPRESGRECCCTSGRDAVEPGALPSQPPTSNRNPKGRRGTRSPPTTADVDAFRAI
jgi:hypothetical protein